MSGYNFPAGARLLYNSQPCCFSHIARDEAGTHTFRQLNGCVISLTREQVRVAVGTGVLEYDRTNQETGRTHVGWAAAIGRPKDIREAERRLAWGRRWEASGCPSTAPASLKNFARTVAETATPDELAVLQPLPSPSTLYRILKLYSAGNKTTDAMMPQIANRGSRQPKVSAIIADLIDRAIDTEFLTPARITVSKLHGLICDQIRLANALHGFARPLPEPSRQTVVRAVERLCPYEVAFRRDGREAADELWRQNGSGMPVTRINERWQIDHTLANIELMSGDGKHRIGRPTMTSVLDSYSRMPMALLISFDPPSTELGMAAMRQAILPKTQIFKRLGLEYDYIASGRCETLLADNGKEFHSESFREALASVNITLEYAPVGKPWYKGAVERFLGTINREVCHRLPGSVYGSVAERGKDPHPEMRPRLTLADLEREVWRWIVQEYQVRNHRGLS